MSHTVRTTITPDVEIEVSEREYLDLKRQGLLAPEPEPEPSTEDAEANTDETPARQPYHARKSTKAADAPADAEPTKEN